MSKRIFIIILASLVVLAVIAAVIIPRLIHHETASITDYWPTDTWRADKPEERGLSSEKLAQALQFIKDEDLQINSLMIIRDGYVLLDATFYNPYDGTSPHDMASVTKSIMTTLIGIAVGQGKINLDQKVLSFFPELTIANLDSRKEALTVRHLVSMTNGFESGCSADDLGTIARMRAGSSDWVQSTLDRKMVQEPGTSFCYDSPGMHLLSAILQKVTGLTALDFAKQYLFSPLGITDVAWETDNQGRSNGWGDVHMYPYDAAKIGYLFLNNGVWNGQQVVPADWVKQATSAQIDAGQDDYGYGWWINDMGFAANGRYGQNIFVVPSLNAIVVTTGGGFEYDDLDPYLLASVIDSSKPLESNPAGVTALQAAQASFMRPLDPLPLMSTPETALAVSGKVYKVGENPYGLLEIIADFNQADEATVLFKRTGGDITLHVGLDNQYRRSSDGSVLRGYWKDSQTFIIDKFDVGLSTVQIDFIGSSLYADISGLKLNAMQETE
jgi:CubicO group peptidase (beta-lactamase class C family)